MAQIETRLDLARHLQSKMAASRTDWLATGDDEEVPGRTMLKTYLVEAHDGEGVVLDRLSQAGLALGFAASATKDPGLFRLATQEWEVWCDISLGRFWRLHTTAPVTAADQFRDKLVGGTRWLDNVWFAPSYLEGLPERVSARMLSFTLNHDRRRLNPRGVLFSESDFVTFRLWSSHAEATLHKLREGNVVPHGVSVRSVKLRSGADETDGEYCEAEYYHHGKITASGTSFDEHNRLVLEALKDYRAVVEKFERAHAMGAVINEDGYRIVAGDPIVLDVEWQVENLEYSVNRMFSSTEPFRLWGLSEKVAPDHFRARAVDLHFGGVLSFDITPRNVVIQLPRGVCGNTIARFLSNLLMHVNSDAQVAA
jgi:hypothetical protein